MDLQQQNQKKTGTFLYFFMDISEFHHVGAISPVQVKSMPQHIPGSSLALVADFLVLVSLIKWSVPV
jgi:hypothetical protein